MPPRRRRIGPRNPRAAQNRNPVGGSQAGVTPYRTIREQEFYGSGQQPRSPNIRPQHDFYRSEINEAIDQASQNLGPEKREALHRAQWLWDDGQLLTTRPTNTSNPPRPRTLAAGYDEQSHTLFVRFRGKNQGLQTYADGVGYEYYDVTPQEWATFRDNWSPGRYINSTLNGKPYTPASW
ncbi:KTSC domain-containing protein [Streptomyces sp. NPDC086776]|uniref:KTSC domain-containing protein n=1 Tax=Streptomyces sp. NPDC086776 TaxID=3365756 RepID=UPI003812F73B